MSTETDDVVITIAGPEGEDDVTLPDPLLDVFANEDETRSEVVGDILMLSCAQRVHALVHHGEDELSEELAAVEQRMMSLFEQHFGVTFAEATGHSH